MSYRVLAAIRASIPSDPNVSQLKIQLRQLVVSLTRYVVPFGSSMFSEEILAAKYLPTFSFDIEEDISVQNFLPSSSLQLIFNLPLPIQAREEIRQLQVVSKSV